jgi:hypothetical protein
MTVVNKREPENPWDGVKLIVRVKRYYTENDNAVDDTYTQEGEPFEVKNQNEFTQKVEAIRDKNVFLKAMAVQENREIYTQKFITKL